MMKEQVSFLLIVLLMVGCSSVNNQDTVLIDGSSTLYPVTNDIIRIYGLENDISDFNQRVSGSISGFEKLCSGEIDISNSSRKINNTEIELCRSNNVEFEEIPVGKDGIAIIVNAQNDWVDYLTVSELKQIWSITSEDNVILWSDIRDDWPDQNLNLFGPTVNSGTYDFFFDAILNDSLPPRGDYVSSEDDEYLGVGITRDKYSLGFFGLAYYKSKLYSLKLVPIDDEIDSNGQGAITPSEYSILKNSYNPFIRQLYIYVNKESLSDSRVMEFVEYYLLHASEEMEDAGYIPEENNIYNNQLNKLQVLK